MLRRRYLCGPAVDQILAEEEVDNGTDDLVQWTLTDHLNTVRDIAKYDPGTDTTTVANHLVYDAFGRVTSESNTAVDSLFLFTARPLDADTGLQNNLHRWYAPAVGRWLSEDPIGFGGGDGNLYRYVGNGPAMFTDATGERRTWDPNQWHQVTIDEQRVRPDADFWGDFSITVNWIVKPPPLKAPKNTGLPETSWIIQHVTAEFDVRDARTGEPIQHPQDDGRWNYWEAWPVAPGSGSPLVTGVVDDTFGISGGIPDTCGTIIISGSAQFYPNTRLPADFISPNPNTHAWDLPATTNASALAGLQPRSFPFVHTAIATWTTENRGLTKLVHSISRPAPEPRPGPSVFA